jgi:hypothetical protein
VVFDPSPVSDRLSRPAESPFVAACRRFADFIRFKWSTMVVTFDTRSRTDFFAWVRRWVQELRESREGTSPVSATLHALLWGPGMLSVWQRILYWLLLVLCAALVVLSVRVTWIVSLWVRENLPATARGGRRRARFAEARFYDRLLLLLANRGFIKPRHQTPREFAAELARLRQDFSELPVMTEWFYEARFGSRPFSREQWSRLRAVLRRLREDGAFGLK